MQAEDRRLLEMAARAAGYDYRPQNGCIVVDGIPGNWNPLIDDGDALRLLTSIGMQLRFVQIDQVEIGNGRTVVEIQWWPGGIKNRMEKVVEVGADPGLITRRAIVSAAAAISMLEDKS